MRRGRTEVIMNQVVGEEAVLGHILEKSDTCAESKDAKKLFGQNIFHGKGHSTNKDSKGLGGDIHRKPQAVPQNWSIWHEGRMGKWQRPRRGPGKDPLKTQAEGTYSSP